LYCVIAQDAFGNGRARMHAHAHTHARTHTHTHSLSLSLSLSLSFSHTLTHTRTHTHTHTPRCVAATARFLKMERYYIRWKDKMERYTRFLKMERYFDVGIQCLLEFVRHSNIDGTKAPPM